jgi:hypothetical protein
VRAVLDATFVALVLIAIVATPFFVVNWLLYVFKRKKRSGFPTKSTLFFIVPVVFGLIIGRGTASIVAGDIHDFLNSLSPNCVISINSKPIQNSDEVLSTLKTFRSLLAHHSHPTHTIQVVISDPPRHLSLEVSRDSEDPHEYWVFVPSPLKLARRVDLKTDIGRIKTSVLDDY